MWRTRALVVLTGLLAVLVAASAAVGAVRHRAQAEQRARYQALVEERFRDQPDRHPHRVAHYGFLVFRPETPLAFLDPGVLAFAGVSLFLEAHRQNSANFSEAAQSDAVARFGALTPAVVVQAVLPLVIFVVAGASVTREREGGTLALLLCQGTSGSTLLAGKLLGMLTLIAAVLLPGGVLTWWVSSSGGTMRWDGDNASRAALAILLQGGYLAACAAIALVISASFRSTRGALTVLLGAWLFSWVLVPRVLPAAASTLHPLPSRAAFEAQVDATLQQLGDSHDPADPAFQRFRAETLARHGVSRIEDLPMNYNGVVMAEGERLTAEAYRRHVHDVGQLYDRQAGVIAAGSLVSPFLAMRATSMALAGSDLSHSLEFERQAEAFRYRLIQALNGLHATAVSHARDRYTGGVEGAAPSRMRIDRAYWKALPTFSFAPPNWTWALSRQLIGSSILMAWTLAAAGAFAWRARRGIVP
jgi:ABC-2 type transport system permease protein